MEVHLLKEISGRGKLSKTIFSPLELLRFEQSVEERKDPVFLKETYKIERCFQEVWEMNTQPLKKNTLEPQMG